MLFLKNQEKFRLYNALMSLKRDGSIYINNREIIDEAINDTISGQVEENKICKIIAIIQDKMPPMEQQCKEAVSHCLIDQESIDEEMIVVNKQVIALCEIIAIFEYYYKSSSLSKTMNQNQSGINLRKAKGVI